MKALQFTPAIPTTNFPADATILVVESQRGGESYALTLGSGGTLAATRFEQTSVGSLDRRNVAAFVHCGRGQRDSDWWLAVCASDVALNGLAPPLAVAALEPGDLLAISERHWLISSLWRPEPMTAPAELCDKPCPVCGGELGLAPVVQCGCGRWTHLGNVSALNDEDALNCFLTAGTCGGCGRPATPEPQAFPPISKHLAGTWTDDDDVHWSSES